MEMQGNALSVSQLNEYLRMLLDGNPVLSSVLVRGEISNFTNHYRTGHFYFSLKDENALVKAVMFRSSASRLAFLPENGMKVILRGRVSVYPRDGQYQIYVEDIQPDGMGSLYLAYEQLRQKLAAEGLFDEERKRPLPPFPKRIGVVTSPTGAAVRDMIQVLGRRYPAAEVVLYPALVQGVGAPESLMAGLKCFYNDVPVDLIIIGRGGGSLEDLFAFNSEALARTVASSPVPVISAVGHETDFTICDFVADLRAPTPSAAAELAVPDFGEVKRAVQSLSRSLAVSVFDTLARKRGELLLVSSSEALRSPRYTIEERRMTLGRLTERLEALTERKNEAARAALATLCARLEGLSPLRVLSRGYAAVFNGAGTPVTKGKALKKGEKIGIRFADVTAYATVEDVRESE